VPPNGLAPGIVQISQRADGRYGVILIDLDFFESWLDSKRLAPLPEKPVTVAAKAASRAVTTTVTKRRKARKPRTEPGESVSPP